MMWDDELTMVNARYVRALNWSTVLFPVRESPVAGRPLVNATFALNYVLGGLNVVGYHIVSVSLHLACALLLFGLVRRTLDLPGVGGRFGRHIDLAFAISLLWTVHPLNSEAVDYLTQRTELMMALFYLWTLYATARAALSHRATWWRASAVAACTLGMACKESMVTAPVLVILYERTFVFSSWREAVQQRKAYYAGLTSSWVMLAALISTGPRNHSTGFNSNESPWMYVLNQTVVVTRYLSLTVWPRRLVMVYGNLMSLTFGQALPYATFILVLLAATGICLVRTPRIGFLGVWFFVTLAPTSSIVPIWTEVGAERRMYVPLAGLIALAVVTSSLALQRFSQRIPAAWVRWRIAGTWSVLFGVAAVLAGRTVVRNRDYDSMLTMARTVMANWPRPTSHEMLGIALSVNGQHADAIRELATAAPAYQPALYYLGGELFTVGRYDEATRDLQRFIDLYPDWANVPPAYAMIGRARMLRQEWPGAIQYLSRAVEMAPANIEARGFLGDAFFQAQRFPEAIDVYRVYVTERPNDVGALSNLGVALASVGKDDLAVTVFQQAVAVDPSNMLARRNLVRELLNTNRSQNALTEAEKAVQSNPLDATAHDLLGRALLLQNRVALAAGEFQKAVRLNPTDQQALQDLASLTVGKH